MDCSPPGSSVQGIPQARIREQVAISFSRGIFPSQGSSPRLLDWQADSLPLSHLGSPQVPYTLAELILWLPKTISKVCYLDCTSAFQVLFLKEPLEHPEKLPTNHLIPIGQHTGAITLLKYAGALDRNSSAVLGGTGGSQQGMCEEVSRSVVPDPLQPHGLRLTKLLCPRDFPGKDTEWVTISFSRMCEESPPQMWRPVRGWWNEGALNSGSNSRNKTGESRQTQEKLERLSNPRRFPSAYTHSKSTLPSARCQVGRRANATSTAYRALPFWHQSLTGWCWSHLYLNLC